MNLDDILSALNDHAPGYRFGGLQDIGKARRPLQRRPTRHPFRSAHEDWAHHVGGREELQFNIGEDEGMLRWGVAISLQPRRSLPDVTILHPRLRKLSSMLETHGDYLQRNGFEMWDWTGGREGRGRSRNRTPQRVAKDLYRPGTFVFVGKQAPFEAFDPDRVLWDFDILLPIYELVEFEPDGAPPALYGQRGFVFEPDRVGSEGRARATTATRTAGVYEVSQRHRELQESLKNELKREGAPSVPDTAASNGCSSRWSPIVGEISAAELGSKRNRKTTVCEYSKMIRYVSFDHQMQIGSTQGTRSQKAGNYGAPTLTQVRAGRTLAVHRKTPERFARARHQQTSCRLAAHRRTSYGVRP